MCTSTESKVKFLCAMATVYFVMYVLKCLYTEPNLPNLSIEEFSVPAFNKTSDQISGDIYFDLKLRNMNKAAGLYYDDPFILSFSYYSIHEPYQKYVWEYTVPAFYQGNGKTKHIRTLIGNHLRPPSMVVDDDKEEEEIGQELLAPTVQLFHQDEEEGGQDLLAPTVPPFSKHVRSLLRSHLQPPSTVVEKEDDDKELTERHQELNYSAAAEVVSFRVDLMFNYRFKLWVDHNTHVLEVGADVMVDAITGERVSKGSIKLVESVAAAGGPMMLMVLFASFVLMVI